MGLNSSRLSFGEVAIATQICYNELKQKSVHEPVVSYNNHIPAIAKDDNIVIYKYDYKSGIPANPAKFKFGQFTGGYIVKKEPSQELHQVDVPLEINQPNNKSLVENISIVWVGPRTRVRIYESDNFTGNSITVENNSYNTIHMVNCSDLDNVINRNNLKSMYVSLIGDAEREIEAFKDQKECISIEKFLLITFLILLIFYLIKYKI
jgi:hypothetical protein